MSGRLHPFFGVLTAGHWKGSANVLDRTVSLELNAEALDGVSDTALDAVASLFGRAPELAGRARAAIDAEQDEPESATATYVDFIGDQLAPEGLEGPALTAHVLGRLVPVCLWSWVEEGVDEPAVVFDFSYAPGELDHVLAVRFDALGEVESVELES